MKNAIAKELQMYKSQPVLRAVNSYGVTARYEALPMKPDTKGKLGFGPYS